MGKIIFITGGQRSGKSRFAQELALGLTDAPYYLATARIWDDEFRERVIRHQSDRDSRWTTLEEDREIGSLDVAGKTVVLDCITLWLTNLFTDSGFDEEASLKQAMAEWDRLIQKDFTLIAVGNELGSGIHAMEQSSRKFADLNGWMNQYVAASAGEVYLMAAGIPIKIKQP